MRRQVVVFDGDDTLWQTEVLYDVARRQSAELVASIGLDPNSFEERQREIDVCNVGRFGLSRERFPTSSVEAYESLAREIGLEVSDSLRSEIFAMSSAVFDEVSPVYPGVI